MEETIPTPVEEEKSEWHIFHKKTNSSSEPVEELVDDPTPSEIPSQSIQEETLPEQPEQPETPIEDNVDVLSCITHHP